jgi:selenocysteine lyase/cysteine desulfurase
MEEHESAMARRLEEGLKSLGVVQHSRAARRTPLLLFSVPGIASTEVYRRLAQADVNAPAGNFYAIECSRWLGLGDHGAVRAGIAPYTSVDDVDQLLNALAAIVRA